MNKIIQLGYVTAFSMVLTVSSFAMEPERTGELRFAEMILRKKVDFDFLKESTPAGDKITVAVLDFGFFQILPGIKDFFDGNDLSLSYSNEFTPLWRKLQAELEMVKPYLSFPSYLARMETEPFPLHGSEMVSHILSLAPQAKIVPVALDDNCRNWHDCLDKIKNNAEIKILN